MYFTKQEFLNFMQRYAPKEFAESYDNVGLLVDSSKDEIKKVLFALDAGLDVIDKAKELDAQLVFTHHPIMFGKGINQLGFGSRDEKIIRALIQNDIALYSAHTNLDSCKNGINDSLCTILGIKNHHSIAPQDACCHKICVFVPQDSGQKVFDAACDAGAAEHGNYSRCSFSCQGKGTFLPKGTAKPYIGKVGTFEIANEVKLEFLAPKAKIDSVVKAITDAHPYETPAIDVLKICNCDEEIGLARIGEISPITLKSFISKLKKALNIKNVRYNGETDKIIKNVAVACGSGGSMLKKAVACGADVLVSGDISHHVALEAREMGIALIDAGHYETERIILPILINSLQEYNIKLEYKTEFILYSEEKPGMFFG